MAAPLSGGLNTKTRGDTITLLQCYNSHKGPGHGVNIEVRCGVVWCSHHSPSQRSGNSPSPRPADSDMGSEWSIIIQSSFCGILPWQAGGKVTRRPLGRKLLGKYLTVFSHWQPLGATPLLITTLGCHYDVSSVSTSHRHHFSSSRVYVSSDQSGSGASLSLPRCFILILH